MTDPGDLATTDANTRSDLPEAEPKNINPGIGEENQAVVTNANEKDQAKVMQTPDPRDER